MTNFAREYGEALYMLASEEGLETELHDQLQMVMGCIEEDPDFARLLDTYSMPLEERLGVVDDVFMGRVHTYLLNYIKILTQRGSMRHFHECVDYYHSRYNETFGIEDAVVVSPVKLSDENLRRIQAKLEGMTTRRIHLIERLDPRLIGGLRVEINGHRIDNTIQTRLEQLRRELLTV